MSIWTPGLILTVTLSGAPSPTMTQKSADPDLAEVSPSAPRQAAPEDEAANEQQPFTVADVQAAARVIGAQFSAAEIELMMADLGERLESFERLRSIPLENAIEPALYFLPARAQRIGDEPTRASHKALPGATAPERPSDLGELIWADIPTLHALIVHRVVSCAELTELFLARLVKVDAQLSCIVSLTADRARQSAQLLDEELAEGHCRGLLHGIPWVAKDLLAVRGTPTTWGATPFRGQTFDEDATVVQRLDQAGAVLIAKVSLGALAWGDVWFGGKTKNPWKPEQGSSGSSAGPAASVAAGGAVFGIGSETLGSIISPSERCGVTSLRPSFGRIGRKGAMTLAWSMDKLGPMARSALDLAIVFDAVHGADAGDPSAVSVPFELEAVLGDPSVAGRRVGFVRAHFERDGEPLPETTVLEELEALGVELVELALPDYPADDMTFVLSAEAASAFDEFSRSSAADQLVRQERHAWPNVFRHARLIPAVDYLRASRLRTLLIGEWNETLSDLDAIVHPCFAGDVLSATNLSGHPTFVAPCGFREDGTPRGICFTAGLHEDGQLLALARAWQASTTYHLEHPGL